MLTRKQAIAASFLYRLLYTGDDEQFAQIWSEKHQDDPEFRLIKRYFPAFTRMGFMQKLPESIYGIGVFQCDKRKLHTAFQEWMNANPHEPTSFDPIEMA